MQEFTVNIHDVKTAWNTAVETGAFPTNMVRKSDAKRIHTLEYATDQPDYVDRRFVGASARQIATALRDGVKPEHKAKVQAVAMGDQEILTPQIELVEEDGDLLIDQVLGGEDLYYARWDHVPTNSGARLRILWNTLAHSGADVMNAYFDWSLSVVDALTAKGMAPSVELRSLSKGTFKGDDWQREILSVTYPLAEAGRITDSVAWRAFLSPGAFRTLGFLGYAMVAKREGFRLEGGLGRSQGTDFGVTYDPQDGILDIVCPSSMPATFPAERMDAMLEEVLTKV